MIYFLTTQDKIKHQLQQKNKEAPTSSRKKSVKLHHEPARPSRNNTNPAPSRHHQSTKNEEEITKKAKTNYETRMKERENGG